MRTAVAKRPTVTEAREVTQTAGKISKGARLPEAARTAATVAGMNWIEDVYKRQI